MKKIKAWIRKQILILRHRYTDYCVVCERSHKNQGNAWEYCDYCKKKHQHNRWRGMTDPETKKLIHICGEYWKERISMDRKVDSMTPQEVLSGVHLGMSEQKGLFREETMKENWSTQHKREMKELYESL